MASDRASFSRFASLILLVVTFAVVRLDRATVSGPSHRNRPRSARRGYPRRHGQAFQSHDRA